MLKAFTPKRFLIVLAAVLGVMLASLSFFGIKHVKAQAEADNMAYLSERSVIIDPGHGGVDGGAVGVGGVVEKGVNLSISLKLRQFFLSAGYRVIMTRQDDRSIHDEDADTIREKKTSDLHNRLDFINANPRAVFISIHQNMYQDRKYSGAQVFFSPNNPESKTLAGIIQDDIETLLQPKNDRVIKMSGKNLFLLYKAKSPAVLIECGFLSNPGEAALLQNDEYQNKMAFAIFYGTLNFYSQKS